MTSITLLAIVASVALVLGAAALAILISLVKSVKATKKAKQLLIVQVAKNAEKCGFDAKKFVREANGLDKVKKHSKVLRKLRAEDKEINSVLKSAEITQ